MATIAERAKKRRQLDALNIKEQFEGLTSAEKSRRVVLRSQVLTIKERQKRIKERAGRAGGIRRKR